MLLHSSFFKILKTKLLLIDSLFMYIYLIIVGMIFPFRKFKYLDLLQSEQIGIFFDRESNPLYILMEKKCVDQDVM